jgi:conjugal transfer pilus assembly protein TraF
MIKLKSILESIVQASIQSVLSILILLVLSTKASATEQNFFEQRYRGWLWFEENAKNNDLKDQEELQAMQKEAIKEERAKARREVEEFAKELEDLRYMMIRYPEDLEHVLAYKKKESEMMDNSISLDQSWRMVNFMNPAMIDLIENPTNLYGRRIKTELETKKDEAKIKEFAKSVELFFFFSKDCAYSNQLEPVLSAFAKKYDFKVEAISADGSHSTYFKTHHNQGQIKELIEKLELSQTPVVIAVTNDSSVRFEFWRGAGALSELEENSILASKFMETLK